MRCVPPDYQAPYLNDSDAKTQRTTRKGKKDQGFLCVSFFAFLRLCGEAFRFAHRQSLKLAPRALLRVVRARFARFNHKPRQIFYRRPRVGYPGKRAHPYLALCGCEIERGVAASGPIVKF